MAAKDSCCEEIAKIGWDLSHALTFPCIVNAMMLVPPQMRNIHDLANVSKLLTAAIVVRQMADTDDRLW